MQQRNDELLIAYLDGELGPSERREVEGWLDIDPVAREKLAALAGSAGLVRLAFDEIMHEPIPDRLIAAARGETDLSGLHQRLRNQQVGGGMRFPGCGVVLTDPGLNKAELVRPAQGLQIPAMAFEEATLRWVRGHREKAVLHRRSPSCRLAATPS